MMKPKNQRKIQGKETQNKGGCKVTIALIRHELLGAPLSDDILRELTGLEPTDPNFDKYFKIAQQIYKDLSPRRQTLEEIRARVLKLES